MPKGRFSHVLLALLMISGAANIALWRGIASTAERSAAGAPAGDGGVEEGATARNRDQAADASAADDKLAFLRSLEQTHLRRAREISDLYWSADGDYQSAYTEALAAGLASMRDDLVGRYGSEVKEHPELRWLFRPLDPLYRFLSSDQQLAVQQLRRERDRSFQAAARNAGTTAPGSGPASAMAPGDAAALAIMQEYQSGLAALLDPATLLEFELRDSAIAQQLRASGVDLSEDEFRQAYSLMASLQDASGDIDDAIEARDRLRGLLGNRRFASLWAARDPMFAEVAGIAERHALPDATAMSVYEVLNEFQDRRMELAKRNALTPDLAAGDAHALAEQERTAIARIVGDEVADEIVRGRALLSYRMFGGSGRPRQDSVRQESQGGRFQ